MDQETIDKIAEKMQDSVDESIEKNLKPLMEAEAKTQALKQIKNVVMQLRAQRFMTGRDKTGLDDEQKKDFASFVIKTINGTHDKATLEKGAQTIESPELGGLLVPEQVNNAILRVAEDFGYVMQLATKLDSSGAGQFTIPNYQGTAASQVWQYLGEDAVGAESSLEIKDAVMVVKKALKLVRLDNVLLKKATVNMADWIISILAESLAYTIDYQGFVGNGSPFVGILNHPDVTVVTMSSGDTAFTDISVGYLRSMVAAVRKGARNNGAFFMEFSVWNLLRELKDSNGDYIFKVMSDINMVNFNAGDQMLKPVGFIDGKYPVYDSAVLPDTGDTAVSTKFVIFGDMRLLAFAQSGAMEVSKSDSATVGGKNVFAAYQTAIRTFHEHGVVVANPQGFSLLKTAAS